MFLGLGTIVMGVIGHPLSKVQIVIGILQFFVTWNIIRYLWAIGWAVIPFLKSRTGEQPLRQGAATTGAYDVGAVKLNPFEKTGGM